MATKYRLTNNMCQYSVCTNKYLTHNTPQKSFIATRKTKSYTHISHILLISLTRILTSVIFIFLFSFLLFFFWAAWVTPHLFVTGSRTAAFHSHPLRLSLARYTLFFPSCSSNTHWHRKHATTQRERKKSAAILCLSFGTTEINSDRLMVRWWRQHINKKQRPKSELNNEFFLSLQKSVTCQYVTEATFQNISFGIFLINLKTNQ